MAKPTPPRAGKSPAFQFYPADWLADGRVHAMTLEEEGAYIHLLCLCWREGSLPAAMPDLARLLKVSPDKMANLWPAIEPCFQPTGDGRLTQRRLDAERRKQATFSRLQSARATAGWNAGTRKRKAPNTIAASSGNAETMPDAALHSSFCNLHSAERQPSNTHTPSVAKPPARVGRLGLGKGQAGPVGFAEFWSLYPRKEGKGAARKVWARLAPNSDLVQRILGAVECQRDWPQWRKDGGQYVPHPATWLNQGRWDDEGGEHRGDDKERIPSGAMTVGEWNRIKESLRKPVPPVFGWGDGDE